MLKEAALHEAVLYEKLADKKVHCYLCAHHCRIAQDKYGFCGVRKNVDGDLVTLSYGKVVARHIDPIEKKPLFHFLPGSRSYSVAAIGCNFQCSFCQNWEISQLSEAKKLQIPSYDMTPSEIAEEAAASGCASVSYTYTEPTIFFEYALATARLAQAAGLANVFVTNGYMTGEALDMIRPHLDAANVDLKFFDDKKYAKICKGTLQPVLDTIARMHAQGVWVEVTTLVIPGENDSDEELGGIARFIAGVGREIPWHVSAFHPDYRMLDHDVTPAETLLRAYEIGKAAGLYYVYRGNIEGEENTHCRVCNELLIERMYFSVLQKNLKDGACPRCGTPLDGKF